MPGMPAGRRLAFMTRAAALLAAALAAAAPFAGCWLRWLRARGRRARSPKPRVLTMLDPFSNSAGGRRVRRRGGAALATARCGSASSPPATSGPDYEAATIRDMQHGRADLAFAGSRAWDEFGVRSLRALQRPAADRQLPAPGARPRRAISSARCSRSCDRWGWWGSASSPAPSGGRSAFEHRAGGTERLQRADDRHPAIARGRCHPARARRPPAAVPCRGLQPWTASTASSTASARSRPTAWIRWLAPHDQRRPRGRGRSWSSPARGRTAG